MDVNGWPGESTVANRLGQKLCSLILIKINGPW